MSKDYYKLLGVEKSASADEIKKAFREKAHQFHPDKQGGDEAKFKEINEAYQVLGNAEKRQQYDQFGSTFDQQGGFGGGMNWNDFMNQARQGGGQYQNINFDFGDLGDIFGDIFGSAFAQGSGGRRGGQRGNDVEVSLTLDFKEAVFGADKQIEIFKYNTCAVCSGSGAEPGSKVHECKTCGGRGQVKSVQRTFLGAIQTLSVCSDCQGQGKRAEKKCQHCGGQGRLKSNSIVKVQIPAGVENGMTLKMSGQGEAGPAGSKPGDLYISLRVKPDKNFVRQGDDIISKVQIPFSVAALGGKVEIVTLDGQGDLKIPAATQSGEVFRLRGKGVPGRGDLLVEVTVAVPKSLNRQQKKILEDLNKEGL